MARLSRSPEPVEIRMTERSLGTPDQRKDPDHVLPLADALPLGIQHVLAMFVSNVTPAIIVATAAGMGAGSSPTDFAHTVYLVQMSMLFAGLATLMQTVGLGPVGARLPVMQGTSFAFIPIMVPAVAGSGVAAMPALMTAVFLCGLFQAGFGFFVGRLRRLLPPLVTGLIVLMIGLALIQVGVEYAAGGVALRGQPAYGSLENWSVAMVVVGVTFLLKFFARGMWSVAAVLLGMVAGYLYAMTLGKVGFTGVTSAAWFTMPRPFRFGWEFNGTLVFAMCCMAMVSVVETVGDVSGIAKGGASRDATDREITGATFADGLGTAVAGAFGALPNTSYSQNVGLVSMTGVMSRHVVTLGALFMIACGLVPKLGAVVASMPITVLGGGAIIMFGMVAAAGMNMLADVPWNRRNMLIFALSLSVGLGLQLAPGTLQHLPDTAKVLMTSGLFPAAVLAIVLNLVLPDEPD
jgi:xanthine permease